MQVLACCACMVRLTVRGFQNHKNIVLVYSHNVWHHGNLANVIFQPYEKRQYRPNKFYTNPRILTRRSSGWSERFNSSIAACRYISKIDRHCSINLRCVRSAERCLNCNDLCLMDHPLTLCVTMWICLANWMQPYCPRSRDARLRC